MKRMRIALVAAAAASALALAGCAGGGGATEEPTEEAAPTFEAGTTMAELSEAGTITVGTKFDQPLFGLVGPDGNPVGFDVEIAKIIASELGIEEDNIEWVETVSANREPFIQNGQVDIVVATYTSPSQVRTTWPASLSWCSPTTTRSRARRTSSDSPSAP